MAAGARDSRVGAASMVEGEEVHMTEPTNAPRVWLRWALAFALATGTVVGSMLPALALDDTSLAQPAANEAAAVAAQQAAAEAAAQAQAEADAAAATQTQTDQPAADQAEADAAEAAQAEADAAAQAEAEAAA